MPGDYTRLTFDPLHDRAMLLEQQGRVHLDADFNELAAILERRLRVETRDIVGPAVYPAIEPDSFKLDGAPAGPWTIGRGRMYVDGLLAENHGAGPMGYEPVWDEPQRTKDTPFDKQPYLGTMPPTPIGSAANELIYLDVFQRELTYVEDPSMLEPALGVDTATRVQTAWQVGRLALKGDGMDCGSDWSAHGPWQKLIRPSDARLTSVAAAPPTPADPCAVAPVGGYRGLENRLYRVEIHDGGAPGAATLKWSRDNGAVASRITALTGAAVQPIITVERLGRDDVLRFHAGEWVELLDDVLELDGNPGVMGQILETDQTQSTVTLTAPLTGAIDLTRNPRLRRWDQTVGINAAGVIPIAASPQTIALEDGIEITVRIDGAGAEAHVADWWVFAARASIGKIEELDEEPPRGVRHHFARLAVLHGGRLVDCRVPWPGDCHCDEAGDCGCTRCVTPESHQDDAGPLTIQAAIDEVIGTGGRVCLAPGRYRLRRPLQIAGAHGLTVAGEGIATIIETPPELGILVEDSNDVALERFAMIADDGKDDDGGFPGVGVALVNTVGCRVERCVIAQRLDANSTGIGLAGWALRTRLLENIVLAGTAIGDIVVGKKVKVEPLPPTEPLPPFSAQSHSTPKVAAAAETLFEERTRYLVSVDLAIEDNLLLGLSFGVRFGDTSLAKPNTLRVVLVLHGAATRVARNLVIGGSEVGLSLLGQTIEALGDGQATDGDGPAGLITAALFRVACVYVRDNVIVASGDGVRGTLEALRIEDNTIHGRGIDRGPAAWGVHVGDSRAVRDAATARIAGNTIADQPSAGVAVSARSGTVEVTDNRVSRTGLGGIGIRGRSRDGDARVLGNVLEDIAMQTEGEEDALLWAIRVDGAMAAAVSGNVVRAFAVEARGPASRVAVSVDAGDIVHIDGNQLVDIGPAADYAGEVVGISVDGPTAVDVRGNTVRIPGNDRRPASIALEIGHAVDRKGVDAPVISGPRALAIHRLASGLFQALGAAESRDHEPVPEGLPQVAVHGNTLESGGDLPVARVVGSCNVTFADNRCRWAAERRFEPVVLLAVVGATIVSANHVEGPRSEEVPAVLLKVGSGGGPAHCTILGNITHGPIELNGGPLVAPWAALNINA